MTRRVTRPRQVPRKGAGHGLPGAEVHLGTAVAGPPGVITVAGVTGTVTAVTGVRGRVIRSRTPMPPARGRHRHSRGTRGTVIAGPPGIVTVRAPAGTVQAVTGTAGRVARPAGRNVPRRGHGHGSPGTAGTAVAGAAGIILLAAPAGGIAVSVNGTPGTVAVTAPTGFVVLVPARFTRWRIPRGFSPSRPRSHVISGPAGLITVTAPAGTVTAGTVNTGAQAAVPGVMIPGLAIPGNPG